MIEKRSSRRNILQQRRLRTYILIKPSDYRTKNIQHTRNSLELIDPYKKTTLSYCFKFERVFDPTETNLALDQISSSIIQEEQNSTLILIGQSAVRRMSQIVNEENPVLSSHKKSVENSAVLSMLIKKLAKKQELRLSISAAQIFNQKVLDLVGKQVLQHKINEPLKFQQASFKSELKANGIINEIIKQMEKDTSASKLLIMINIQDSSSSRRRIVSLLDFTDRPHQKKKEKDFANVKISSVISSYFKKKLGDVLQQINGEQGQRDLEGCFAEALYQVINKNTSVKVLGILYPSESNFEENLQNLQFIERVWSPFVEQEVQVQDLQVEENVEANLAKRISELNEGNKQLDSRIQSLRRQFRESRNMLARQLGGQKEMELVSKGRIEGLTNLKEKVDQIHRLTQKRGQLDQKVVSLKNECEDMLKEQNKHKETFVCEMIRLKARVTKLNDNLSYLDSSIKANEILYQQQHSEKSSLIQKRTLQLAAKQIPLIDEQTLFGSASQKSILSSNRRIQQEIDQLGVQFNSYVLRLKEINKAKMAKATQKMSQKERQIEGLIAGERALVAQNQQVIKRYLIQLLTKQKKIDLEELPIFKAEALKIHEQLQDDFNFITESLNARQPDQLLSADLFGLEDHLTLRKEFKHRQILLQTALRKKGGRNKCFRRC